MLTACSSNEDLAGLENAQQYADKAPVNFSIYTQRTLTRAGAPGIITTEGSDDPVTTSLREKGFGILAYYTNDGKYDKENSKPNFMYNTQVTSAGENKPWTYNPVMYWPNEYGAKATSEMIDFVTFFAYAPYVEVEPTTGVPVNAKEDEKNITAISKNNAGGDPIVKYVVDTDPSTSVDLLWGVAAENPTSYYSKGIGGNAVTINAGEPFIDLVKPNDPVNDEINFNMRHALAKLNVNIKYVSDATTPEPGNTEHPGTIKAEETKIYVRSIKIGGFVMKGALNLHNTTANKANWLAYDGLTGLVLTDVVFKDGRRDGAEGTESGEDTSETPLGLNPEITEVYNKNYPGVTKDAVNVFGNGDAATAPIFVIPTGKDIDIEIVYDVETKDEALSTYLSDGVTHGVSVEKIIKKKSKDIFGEETKMQDNHGYQINIILGMTSVKIEAKVIPFTPTDAVNVDMPENQDETSGGSGETPSATTYNVFIYPNTTDDAENETGTVTISGEESSEHAGYKEASIAGTGISDYDGKTYYISNDATSEGTLYPLYNWTGTDMVAVGSYISFTQS